MLPGSNLECATGVVQSARGPDRGHPCQAQHGGRRRRRGARLLPGTHAHARSARGAGLGAGAAEPVATRKAAVITAAAVGTAAAARSARKARSRPNPIRKSRASSLRFCAADMREPSLSLQVFALLKALVEDRCGLHYRSEDRRAVRRKVRGPRARARVRVAARLLLLPSLRRRGRRRSSTGWSRRWSSTRPTSSASASRSRWRSTSVVVPARRTRRSRAHLVGGVLDRRGAADGRHAARRARTARRGRDRRQRHQRTRARAGTRRSLPAALAARRRPGHRGALHRAPRRRAPSSTRADPRRGLSAASTWSTAQAVRAARHLRPDPVPQRAHLLLGRAGGAPGRRSDACACARRTLCSSASPSRCCGSRPRSHCEEQRGVFFYRRRP